MLNYTENLECAISAEANKQKKNLHLISFIVDELNVSRELREKYAIDITRKFDVISFLNQHSFLDSSEAKRLKSFINDKKNIRDLYYCFEELVSVYAMKIIEDIATNFNGSYERMWNRIDFYFNEDKTMPDFIQNEIERTFYREGFEEIHFNVKSTLKKPQKYVLKDMLGNDIIIGDIGVGNGGKGNKCYPLKVVQVERTSEVSINGGILPSNFIVLKPIDGRQIKGV